MHSETINKTKRPSTEWEKIFANTISINGLISKLYKELIQLNILKNPGGTVVKNSPANAGNTGSSPGPGRSHTRRSN